MTISTITPVVGNGLTYVKTQLISTNKMKSSGNVVLVIVKKKGLSILVREYGLQPKQSYDAFIGFQLSNQTHYFHGMDLGHFIANNKGDFQGEFSLMAFKAIPEIGYHFAVTKAIKSNRSSSYQLIPYKAIVQSGVIGGITNIIQQVRTGLLDNRYLVVGYLSPLIPFIKKNANQYLLSPEVYSPISHHRLLSKEKVKNNELDLQIGFHIFDIRTGMVVRKFPFHVTLTAKNTKITIPYFVSIYNAQYGQADTNFANAVALPFGNYEMDINENKKKMILAGFSVNETSGFLVNPLVAMPVAIISEHAGIFKPSSITIRIDQKLRFLYEGIGYESFEVDRERSPLLAKNQYWDYLFAKRGVYSISLAYAPTVKMRVIVK